MAGAGAPAKSASNPAGPGASRSTAATDSLAITLRDYEFEVPRGWTVETHPDHLLLRQSADGPGCILLIFAPQAATGNLEQEVSAVFGTMYPQWTFARTGEQRFLLSRGYLPKGLPYHLLEASMSRTDPDGRYQLEDGAAMVVRANGQSVILAARHHTGLMAHNDCINRYDTWRRFFNSFTVKRVALPAREERDLASRFVGLWSQSGGGAIGEYAFAANGNYQRGGGIGSARTTRDERHEYLHVQTHVFAGDGSYGFTRDLLTLNPRRGAAETARFRFEEINRGGAGWQDRLWLLKRDAHGELEVAYDRKPVPAKTTR